MGLDRLCELITINQLLRKALVISTEAHIEYRSLSAPHRCLLVQTRLLGGQDIWLRLDRRRDHDVNLIRALGVTAANDKVFEER